MGGKCSHKIITLNQTDADTGPNDIVLMIRGRTGEFDYKWK